MRSWPAGLLALCLAAAAGMPAGGQGVRPALRVETRSREFVVEYGPITLPPGADHSDMHQPPPVVFPMPIDGWVRGYVVELVDRAGRRLPSRLLHHVNFIAKNKRDLFSSVMLRVGAAGPETQAVVLPRLLGVRMHPGDTVVMAIMLHNPTDNSYPDARVRVRVPFTAASSRIGAISVYPFSVAIGPKERPNVFDLPPGRSEQYWEGSPAAPVRLLGLSGHLHRYGVALRLEDRTTGEVMWEAPPKADRSGEVLGMPLKFFLWSAGKPMRPDHVYRLTAIYDNPERRTIPDGGMGVLGGIVILSRHGRWPAVDPRHPEYVVDLHAVLHAPNWTSHCAPAGQPHAHHARAPVNGHPIRPAALQSGPPASPGAPGCSSLATQP